MQFIPICSGDDNFFFFQSVHTLNLNKPLMSKLNICNRSSTVFQVHQIIELNQLAWFIPLNPYRFIICGSSCSFHTLQRNNKANELLILNYSLSKYIQYFTKNVYFSMVMWKLQTFPLQIRYITNRKNGVDRRNQCLFARRLRLFTWKNDGQALVLWLCSVYTCEKKVDV